MKKIFNILASAAVVLSVAACDLDLTPRGSIVADEENLITNATDLAGFEADVMAQLRGLEYGVYDNAPDIMVDYFNATLIYGNNYGPIHRMDDSFTSGDYDSEDQWENFYYAIRHFNIVINGCQTVPEGLEKDAAIARGEAYFARAFAYLHMTRIFGKPYAKASDSDLGVPLVLAVNINDTPARATVKECYAQIKKDLDSASTLLAGVKGSVRAQKPSVDAVNALYARYYIDVADYTNAAAKATAVINTGNYALSSTAEEFEAEYSNDEGSEPIMQFYASISEGGIGYHSYFCSSESVDNSVGTYYQPYYIPCATLVNAYDASDLRLQNWFSKGEKYVLINGVWSFDEFYTFNKYPGNMALTSGSTHTTGHAIKPFLISEMYLIAAEAYAKAGNTSNAATYLNALQSARGASTTTGDLVNVKSEWYKETVGEGLRMSCLKRWGDGFSGRPAQSGATVFIMTGSEYENKSLAASDYHWQWPVPKYELQVNDNLVQNEGYASE